MKLTKVQKIVIKEIVSRKEEIRDFYEKGKFSEIAGSGMVHSVLEWSKQHGINLDCINSVEDPKVGQVTLLVFSSKNK